MLTIHCHTCNKDEVLSGVPGTPGSPLPVFRQRHKHGRWQWCRVTCPCGSYFEIDSREILNDQKAVDAHSNQAFEWSKRHVQHMQQAECRVSQMVN